MQESTSSQAQSSDLFTELPVNFAGFWERFGAVILDALILLIPNYLLRYFFGDVSYSYFISGILMRWLYDSLQESGVHQATLGKRALRIKVTDINGQRISFLTATGRHFGKYLSALIIFVGYLMMLWDNKKQTLHDKMAGTLVVKQYYQDDII